MATYKTYEELKDNILQYDDLLDFLLPTGDHLIYAMATNHLRNTEGSKNERIFVELGITDPRSFCSTAYGYGASNGLFPASEYDDYRALTRVALALFERCEAPSEKPIRPKKPELQLETKEIEFTIPKRKHTF